MTTWRTCGPWKLLVAVGIMLALAVLALHRSSATARVTRIHRLPGADEREASEAPPLVAISISGASRGSATLRSFTTTLSKHVIRPAGGAYGFHVLVWLQDDDAETLVHSLLADDVLRCLTRRRALDEWHPGVEAPPRGSASAREEAASIAADHPPSLYVEAGTWVEGDSMSLNTLRMLHKLRGAEWLRQLVLAGAEEHAWVLRLRPDLELHSRLPLPLPPRAARRAAEGAHGGGGGGERHPHRAAAVSRAVYVPWVCSADELCFDQWMLLPPAAAERLAMLYEPAALWQLMTMSKPPSLYPERLLWKALAPSPTTATAAAAATTVAATAVSATAETAATTASAVAAVELSPPLGAQAWELSLLPSAPSHHLLGADGEVRDAHAKLKRDFPSCFRRSEASS